MPIERQMQRYIVNSEITQYTVYSILIWKRAKEIIQTLSQLSWRVDTVRVATEDYSNIFSSNICFEPLSANTNKTVCGMITDPKYPKEGGRWSTSKVAKQIWVISNMICSLWKIYKCLFAPNCTQNHVVTC